MLFDGGTWTALALAVALLLLAGLWHLFWLRALNRLNRGMASHGNLAVLFAFWGIALLHLSEIAIGAMTFAVAVNWLHLGSLGPEYGDAPGDYLYFAGLTYTAMGFEQDDVGGPVRVIATVNALAGLMLLTWSATYVYSIWGTNFREAGEEREN